MNFPQAKEYLYSLGNEVETMKLGLENVRRLLAELGDPQKKYLKVQVAGTNGKGSVCAFLRSICVKAGINAGVYTSPHLVSITERINIGGVDITEDEFARVATIVRDRSEHLAATGEIDNIPTFFEQMTAIALLAFAEANVQLAILETGLGGRLDATTAANAEIAAITRIDYDHQEYLGNTIEEIAAEKAAIIHAGTAAVAVGAQTPQAVNPIVERCCLFGIEITYSEFPRSYSEFGEIVLEDEKEHYVVPRLGLAGRHQIENAWTAILVANSLSPHFSIDRRHIESGLENARHPGRLEQNGQILFDGAHNAGSAKVLREFLDEFEPRPITLVFGAMRGKDIAVMAKILFPKGDHIILTRPNNERAMATNELRQFVPGDIEREKVFTIDPVEAALNTARELTHDDGVILVTGSLYLVGEVKRILKSQI